jgi:uncharacterized protein YdhG (YjbR/CyaY superfamily)
MTIIDEYLNEIPIPERTALERIRQIIKQTLPDTEEVISYGMPGFKYKNRYLAGFAPFKDHLSFFPAARPIAAMEKELGAFKLSKGTIQFTLDNQIPETIIKQLVMIRADQIDKAKK